MTPQRRLILEELRGMRTHPTADHLYEAVRRRLPRISLGTVYRNLDLLSRDGLINRIEVGGMQKRFDGDTALHYHKRCVSCGRVDDAHVPAAQAAIDAAAKEVTDYHILGHRLEFIGLCPQCAVREKPSEGRPEGDQKGETA
ncbi:MAG: transcriptional repressor [Candidatus Eiseniibacteriota bacterium]|nr:MAG: transcriptional repressor [Candidatus Eisenbacteria bacterium]